MRRSRGADRAGVLVVLLVALASCVPLSPLFSATAYEQATALKAQSLTMMSRAIDSYGEHEAEVEALTLEIDKAIEYARGRPRNDIVVAQWELLMSPDTALLGAFFARWEEEGSLGAAFVDESRRQVASAFDAIIGLESGLVRESDL